MEKLRRQFEVSFSTKVVVPVVGTMIVLIAITVSIVNSRITRQFQAEAVRSLAHAEESVRRSREIHLHNQLTRFRGLPDEPMYRALFTLSAGEAATIRGSLDEMRTNKEVDIVLYTKLEKPQQPIASSRRDAAFMVPEFEAACAPVIEDCFKREAERVDTVQVGVRLFDIVTLPVRGAGRDLIGSITLGSEIVHRTAQDMKEATQCEIVLLENNRVIASTAGRPELHDQFARIFTASMAEGGKTAEPSRVPLGNEHYFCSAGQFPAVNADGKLGYLLLASYEQPLRSLRTTQQILVGVSGFAVLLGAGV